ncbi:MAG: aldo/keto reductase [Bryobacteraceae bacterium]|nr:aldo/keto reductase [Bryobacteraceae bacterium]
MGISRRSFLGTAAVGSLAGTALHAGVDKKTGMPMRELGKTGARVSILGFGCGSRFLMYKEEDKALEALTNALDAGINYVDTAFSYGDGESERRVGLLMKDRRQGIWLATKITPRKYDDIMRIFEGSLKRLQTDHVDLLHMHGLGNADDLAAIEAPDGALKAVYKLRDEKTARFVGVTCHQDPTVLKTLLERHDLDCTQMALNAARMGAGAPSNERGAPVSFETAALPVALRKKMGVTAMKVFAQEKILGEAPTEQLMRYSMSLPVASAIVGMPKLEHISENVRVAKAFKKLSDRDMRDLSGRMSQAHKARIDAFFRDHQDA